MMLETAVFIPFVIELEVDVQKVNKLVSDPIKLLCNFIEDLLEFGLGADHNYFSSSVFTVVFEELS
jgi:hypothetical protein